MATVRTPRTLTNRLVAAAVLLVAVVSALVALVTNVAMDRYLTGQLDEDVHRTLARALAPRFDSVNPGTPGSQRDYGPVGPGTIAAVLPSGAASQGMYITRSGAYRTLDSDGLTRLRRVAVRSEPVGVSVAGHHYRVLATRDDAGNRVVVGLSTDRIDATTDSLLLWSSLLALTGVGLAWFVGQLLVRRQLQPLHEVAATAHEVSRLDLSTGEPGIAPRVADRLTDEESEVGRVGSALNSLLDHVDQALNDRHRSEQQVRQFVADASHELRTPLATIHGYAELSRRQLTGKGPEDAAALLGALGKVETETDRMSGLVEDLLLLARLDSGRPLARVEVDLTRLLLEAVTDARVLAPDHHWRLELPDEPVTTLGDGDRLHQVVTNLLTNARVHTPAGTTVTVRVADLPQGVRLDVHDDGPGLPAGLVDEAFDRFTRGDSSRTRSSGGAGLGLSLVSAIAAAHGGQASVSSAPGNTTFTVTLP